jgi:tRNA wybutosine-synthesizing protein 4
LPAGPDHSFAKTMLEHFAKQTPLQSVCHYPTLNHQTNRFLGAGYHSVNARSLWDFWEDDASLSVEEKRRLNKVEPFDEWEDFILFASHYVILQASGTKPFSYNQQVSQIEVKRDITESQRDSEVTLHVLQWSPLPKHAIGTSIIGSLRLEESNSLDVTIAVPTSNVTTASTNYWTAYGTSMPLNWPSKVPITGISYYTITPIGSDASLLVGGRTSPSKANSQCFVYRKSSNTWTRVQDLEFGRYRHNAISIQIGTEPGVLVFGGTTSDNQILSDWILWTERVGWISVPCISSLPTPLIPALFGASMIDGIILGGIDESYKIGRKVWRWSIDREDSVISDHEDLSSLKICIVSMETNQTQNLLARFAGTLLDLSSTGPTLIGGVGPVPLKTCEEVCHLSGTGTAKSLSVFNDSIPRPFLIGAVIDILDTNTDTVLITRGGGVCFSFGSCFNSNWYVLQAYKAKDTRSWRSFTADQQPQLPIINKQDGEGFASKTAYDGSNAECIAEKKLVEMYDSISNKLEPVVARQIDIGSCKSLWNLKYLDSKMGSDNIAIHEGPSRYLTFTPKKNFKYRTCSFSDFKACLERREHVYLRALASNATFKEPANFWNDFPTISEDFKIPEALEEALGLKSRLHSAVLRISGDVSIWIHYDVMSNFYFQVFGYKTFILFPPSEALKLKFAPGSTVSPIDSRSDFKNISHRIVHLKPGDVLFIPRFWGHTTFNSQTDDTTSIAINIFWRDLDGKAYASGKDVYGNRDLAVYEHSRETIRHIASRLQSQSPDTAIEEEAQRLSACILNEETVQHISGAKEAFQIRAKMANMPKDVGQFYLPRLAEELVELCSN